MSKSWASGSTTAWRKTRALVLARDGYVCKIRGPRCTHVADCVHHTIGRQLTGDDPAHLVASCTPCNLHIGNPTTTDPPHRGGRTRW